MTEEPENPPTEMPWDNAPLPTLGADPRRRGHRAPMSWRTRLAIVLWGGGPIVLCWGIIFAAWVYVGRPGWDEPPPPEIVRIRPSEPPLEVDPTGSPPSRPRARREYYRLRAEAGDVSSIHQYGLICLDGTGADAGDIPEARRWFEKGAVLEHPPSIYMLGEMRYHGQTDDGMPDLPGARQWYRRAADLGEAEAMFSLGYMCQLGVADPVGVTDPNKDEAREWYERAARKGHGGSRHALARMWLDGELGVKGSAENLREGRLWLQRASEAGFSPARTELVELGEEK